MRQLTMMDSAFVNMETPRTPSHVLPIFVYDVSTAPGQRVSFNDIMNHVGHKVHEARTLRERLVRVPFQLDWPYWIEDDNFDLEFHVRHAALPKPGTLTQLFRQIERLHARPLDLTRPPWEMYVIEGVAPNERMPNGGFAVVMKVHHAAIDGVAGVELVNLIHSQTPDVESLGPPPPVTGEREPSPMELLGRTMTRTLSSPRRFYGPLRRMARTPVRRVVSDLRSTLRTVPRQPPRTRFNGSVTPHRSIDCRVVPLSEIKRIKRVTEGATVNDVALTIVGGALRSYLQSKSELPDSSLIASVPVSIRVGSASEGGNQISTMTVPIGTHVADPVERLAFVASATSEQKVRLQGVDIHSQLALSDVLPGALLGLGIRAVSRLGSRLPVVANTVVTNVPGSPNPMYLLGAKVAYQFGGGPVVDGVGLINLVGSYADDFGFSFTACREMIPDSAFYGDCLVQSFEDISAGNGGERAGSGKGSRARVR